MNLIKDINKVLPKIKLTKTNISSINPYYISGFTQADGSFFCVIKINRQKFLQFSPTFSITADSDSKFALEKIRDFFNCGTIYDVSRNNTAEYKVTNLTELQTIIIPHFKNYPVFFKKLHAFNLFTLIVELLIESQGKDYRHFDFKTRNIKLTKLVLSMNKASLRSQDRINKIWSLLNVDLDHRQLIENNIQNLNSNLTDEFITGLIDGDGSFFISLSTLLTTSNKTKIKPGLDICSDSKLLLEAVKEKLGNIGAIGPDKSIFKLRIRGLNQILDKLIPFMKTQELHTEKKDHYMKWLTVCELLKNNSNLTDEQFKFIINLTYNMNKHGKRRKYTKKEFLALALLKKEKD